MGSNGRMREPIEPIEPIQPIDPVHTVAPGLSSASHSVERRLTALEIKATYTEDLLDQLDQVVIRQQEQIDALTRQLVDLLTRQSQSPALQSPRDDLPPHF